MDAVDASVPGGIVPSRTPLAPIASVTGWLGVLFALLLLLVAVGGYVRLSGSGLSIPDWPVIRVGDHWSLLPPTNQSDWLAVRERYDHDQVELEREQRSGVVGLGSLGAEARDMPTFKRMFITEWCHRFVAALVAVVATGALVVTLRHREVRQRIGGSYGIACGLIVFQAVLGGILVKSGTSTHWLFFHLGTAALILALVVWSVLRLVSRSAAIAPDLARRRRLFRRVIHVAIALVWLQLMLGALVAGSRISGHDGEVAGDFVTEWPLMHHQVVPAFLWAGERSLGWNLLDNALLHQWVHRTFAWLAVASVVAAWRCSRRASPGPRLRLALQVALTFLGVQALLGIANVVLATPILVSLAHLVMAMFLLSTLMLALHDARYESDAEAPVPDGRAVTA
jgi:cytochrome c oxidase assembly protein subunit 15